MSWHYEYLARDRVSEAHQKAREQKLARELSAQRRWHRVAVYAQAAERRHAREVHRRAAH